MPVWEYLGYFPWSRERECDEEVTFLSSITRWPDVPEAVRDFFFGKNPRNLIKFCQQNAQAQEARSFEELECAYRDGDFERGPNDEIGDGPLDKVWAEAEQNRWDESKRVGLRATMLPREIRLRQKYAIGRAHDLLEEAQEISWPRAYDAEILEILNDMLDWITARYELESASIYTLTNELLYAARFETLTVVFDVLAAKEADDNGD